MGFHGEVPAECGFKGADFLGRLNKVLAEVEYPEGALGVMGAPGMETGPSVEVAWGGMQSLKGIMAEVGGCGWKLEV